MDEDPREDPEEIRAEIDALAGQLEALRVRAEGLRADFAAGSFMAEDADGLTPQKRKAFREALQKDAAQSALVASYLEDAIENVRRSAEEYDAHIRNESGDGESGDG